MNVLSLIGELAPIETRAEAARALADALGAEDLVLFLRDQELGMLVPAPGFVQTIRRGAVWRSFLAQCLERTEWTGTMPNPRRDTDMDAVGYRIDGDAVLVFLGGDPDRTAITGVLPLFPLVVAIARSEDAMRTLTARAHLATTAAAQGEVLAHALARSRDQIRDALTTASEARRVVEEQAEELSATAEELEQSKNELEAINAALVHANEALLASSADADRARAIAEQANRTKSDFLAMMSHELRTPLNAIGGYAALLEEGIMGSLEAGQRKYLVRIKRSQVHLSALINDVLNFAKAESGTISYNVEPLALRQVLASVAPLIEPMAESRNVVYHYDAPSVEVVVDADRDKVVQVVLNLLTNAVKFTPPHGRVTLRFDVTASEALVTVSDSGPGIPAEQQLSIFEPFVQLERSFAQEREGVGLGLSISRELARGMKGDLTVQSVLGRGSRFIFSLPRSQKATESVAAASPVRRDAPRLVERRDQPAH